MKRSAVLVHEIPGGVIYDFSEVPHELRGLLEDGSPFVGALALTGCTIDQKEGGNTLGIVLPGEIPTLERDARHQLDHTTTPELVAYQGLRQAENRQRLSELPTGCLDWLLGNSRPSSERIDVRRVSTYRTTDNHHTLTAA